MRLGARSSPKNTSFSPSSSVSIVEVTKTSEGKEEKKIVHKNVYFCAVVVESDVKEMKKNHANLGDDIVGHDFRLQPATEDD